MTLIKKTLILFSTLCLIYYMIPSKIVNAEEDQKKMVQVKGYSLVVNGNIANARDRAIQYALRQAVEQTVGMMISSTTKVENDKIEEQIFCKTSGYIETYHVDKSYITNKNTFFFFFSAVVKVGELEKNLEAIGLLREQMGNPRIMVLFRRRNKIHGWNSISPSINIAEISLMNEFVKHDDEFNFVDRSRSNISFNGATENAAVLGNIDAIIDLCHTYHVDYLIIGETEVNLNKVMLYNTAIDTAQASVSAKIVRASTGQIVGSEFDSGEFSPVVEKQSAGAKAIDIAAKKLGKKLMPKILEHWRKEVTGTHNIIVTVKNTDFNDLSLFEVLLTRSITGITKIDRMEFSEGKAIYQVKSRTNANQIGEEVNGQRLRNKKLQVISLTNGRVDLLCK